MINHSIHNDLKSAKDWILANQNEKGAILWDQTGNGIIGIIVNVLLP